MKSHSARTMVVLSAILLLLGAVVMSPSAGLLMVVLAVLSAIPPLFSSKGYRIAGTIILILSLAFATSLYPKFRMEQTRYMERVKNKAVQPQMSTTTVRNK